MDARTPRHHHHQQRLLRTPRGPATPHNPRHPATPTPTPGHNPSRYHVPALAPLSPRSAAMEDDAITNLMDIDDSPRSAAGAGFLDDDDEGDLLHAHRMGGRGNEARGPLSFAGFFNTFDGADFDDSDLA